MHLDTLKPLIVPCLECPACHAEQCIPRWTFPSEELFCLACHAVFQREDAIKTTPTPSAEEIAEFLTAMQTSQQETDSAEEFDRNQLPLIKTSMKLFGPQERWTPNFDEGQRQLILLALHQLREERPGWDLAIQEIETQLGGQLPWPT